jgi:hypothetical protein
VSRGKWLRMLAEWPCTRSPIERASYAEIGCHFCHRDHTTVLHACRRLTDLIARDDATRRLAAELETQIAAEIHF